MMGRFKRKKVVKQRGHRTHGWGNPKKHRNKGSRGGKGLAGKFGQKMTYILKHDPDRIGLKGFNAKTSRKHRCTNIRDADRLAGKNKAIDLGKFGYDKLLGKGEIARALEITVTYCSAKAKEKVEAAGGKVIAEFTAEEEEVKEAPKAASPASAKAKSQKEKPAKAPKEEAQKTEDEDISTDPVAETEETAEEGADDDLEEDA
jgi:large subunit ribosomal protein L15